MERAARRERQGKVELALDSGEKSGKLVVALEGAWQPWSYHDASDTLVGYDVEVSRAIAEKLGVEPEYVESDWDSLFAGLDAGRFDMVCNGVEVTDGNGEHVAIEIKRNGGIDGVEQLTRYCDLLNRDPLLAPVHGIFAAQTITPQARVLAQDRGFKCLILDYEEMKGTEDDSLRLF